MYTLNVETRTKDKTGTIPAVFYGPKQASTSVTISLAEFLKVWKKAGESAIITLKGLGDEHEALIHDIDLHPVTGTPRHADFYVIEKGKKLQIDVPLVYEGISGAVKDLGGILVKVMHEVKIEALPKDLPRELKVDLSLLSALDSTIHAKDLVLPAGVTLLDLADEVVASIDVAREEVVEESTTIDMSAIEVEKKGKEPKEGEEGEVAASK